PSKKASSSPSFYRAGSAGDSTKDTNLSRMICLVPTHRAEKRADGFVRIVGRTHRCPLRKRVFGEAGEAGVHTSATFVPRSHELRDVQRVGAVPEWRRATLVALEYSGFEHRLLTQQRQHVVVDRDQVADHPVDAVSSRLRLDERFGLRHALGV